MATATQTSKILSAEQEAKLRQPIDEYVGKIQAPVSYTHLTLPTKA